MTLDGVWNYVYDAENRLVQMTTTSSAVTAGFPNRTLEFKYDYLGRRVQKRSENVTAGTDVYSRYLYDGNNLIAEFNATSTTIGSLLRSYTWGLDLAGSLTATGGVGALVQITDHATSTSYFPTFDGNGNVASLLNASSGAVVAAYEYSPFGELLRCAGSYATSNPFRFSTKFTDDESGLVYYGHRYYSPGLGRFINRDPIEEAGGLNLYGFCGNDGVNGIDCLGNRNFFSNLWDHTFGAIGKGVGHAISSLQRWSNAHPVGAFLLTAVFPEMIPFDDVTNTRIVWHAAQRNPQIAAVVAAIATWYIGGWGAYAMGFAYGTTANVVIAGASAGFGGGFVGARASGASLSDSFRAGYQGAAVGGALAFAGSEFLGMKPSTQFGWKSAEWAFATSETRYEVGRFAQNKLGINGWEFDAALLALSYGGNQLLGDRISTDANGDNYISGFNTRNSGITNAGLHFLAEFPSDVVDTVLNYQGLPSATGLEIAFSGNAQNVMYGHSLGALEYSTLAALGVVNNGAALALPLGGVAPSGVTTAMGAEDPITAFGGARLLNWDAVVFPEPQFSLSDPFGGHALDPNYQPYVPVKP